MIGFPRHIGRGITSVAKGYWQNATKDITVIIRYYLLFLIRFCRAVAYRWLIRWLCGFMGWDTARPLSACMYNYVRREYYTATESKGYSKSVERQ